MSERPLLIKGGRLVDPSARPSTGSGRTGGNDAGVAGDLLVTDGLIAASGKVEGVPDDAVIIDAQGLVLTPGFIDLHTHLREPGFEDKETIATGAAAGARGGFTTLCAMPNTSPAIDNATVVDFITQQARAAGAVRVLCFGAVTRDRAGKELSDMEELAKAGVVGFTDDGAPVATGSLMQMALLYSDQLGLFISDHCEDHGIAHGAGIHEGWVSSRLGLAGYPPAAEESMIARDIALAEATGGHFHVAHISTAGGVQLVRQAKARGLRVTAEVTPHHLTMTDAWLLGDQGASGPETALTAKAYETRAKVSPPLRSEADRIALVEALAGGTIDAIATDHAPHTFGDKAVPFEEAAVGISVLETALGSLMGLVHAGVLDLQTLVHRLTVGPALLLGPRFAVLATLREGTPADLVLFDPNEAWKVNVSEFASKGKNTPLDGVELRGRVKLTVAQGRIAYDEVSK